METSLIVICTTNLFVVMVTLALMAGVMRGLTSLFPERDTTLEPAVAKAIRDAVAETWPGAEVTKIEEINAKP